MPRIPDLFFAENVALHLRGALHLSDGANSTNADPIHYRLVSDQQYKVATTYLILTPIFQVVAVSVFFARAFTRVYPTYRFGIDDYIISIASVLMTIMWALQFNAVTWASGFSHPEYRSRVNVQHSIMSGTIALPFWAWSTGLVKISIACMLLKFQQSRGWRYFVYFIIVLNVFFISWLGIANSFSCTPYASQWDLTGKYKDVEKCWSKQMGEATIYVTVSCCVISDVILSLVPLTFLSKVRRPLREKVVIGALMSLGVTASGFSIARLVTQVQQNRFTDKSALAIFDGLLTCLEVQVGLIAACIPMLRSSANRWLQRLGIWRGSSSYTRYQRYGPDRETIISGSKGRGVLELDQVQGREGTFNMTMVPEQEQEREAARDSGHESGQYIMDPDTGRIIRVTNLKDHKSSSNLNEEWRGGPGKAMEEEWEMQRDIGYAR